MLKLLRLLFLGHEHKYEIIERINIRQDKNIVGTKWILQCTKCGQMTKFQSIEE